MVKTDNMDCALKLTKVNYSYPDGRTALTDIDLDVSKGETLLVVGPNGAGKSTLLTVMCGLYEAGGYLSVAGTVFSKETAAEVRRRVGLVFQDPDDQLFMPTVFDDVAFGPVNMKLDEHEVKHCVEDALNMVGLSGFEKRVCHHLSYGEKKLVCIAGVLAMDPEILVLDEPTANLDPRAKRHLVAILRELPQTKIISSHDMNIAYELADRVAVMYRTRFVAVGPAAEILTDEKLLLKYGLEMPTIIRG
ncbi:MAG: ABC transporter ATP-binding protein [Actinomycetota bacterium]